MNVAPVAKESAIDTIDTLTQAGGASKQIKLRPEFTSFRTYF